MAEIFLEPPVPVIKKTFYSLIIKKKKKRIHKYESRKAEEITKLSNPTGFVGSTYKFDLNLYYIR